MENYDEEDEDAPRDVNGTVIQLNDYIAYAPRSGHVKQAKVVQIQRDGSLAIITAEFKGWRSRAYAYRVYIKNTAGVLIINAESIPSELRIAMLRPARYLYRRVFTRQFFSDELDEQQGE